MRQLRAALLVALCGFFFAGCAYTRATYDPVAIGMSPQVVRARLGPPERVSANASGQHWLYKFERRRDRRGAQYGRLEFEDGRLVEMENMPGWATTALR